MTAVTPGPVWQRRLAGVYLEFRAIPVLLWSFSGITIGTALAWPDGPRTAGWFVAALVIGALLQGFVAHTVNEIADWRSGTDADAAPRIISGGSKVVLHRLLDERELSILGAAAAAAATGLGLVTVASRGWWLLALGAIGLIGAVAYTLPPIAAAYVPFAGEAVAFLCVWACVAGGYGVQRGTLSPGVALVGVVHGAYCISMLMLHHQLDRGPDARAVPPKRTSVVRLGSRARGYGVGWSAAAIAAGALSAALVDVRTAPMAAAGAVALAAHVRIDPDDVASVTRWELAVIAAGVVGALSSAIWIAPSLAWVAACPPVLVAIELSLARRWIPAPAPTASGLDAG